jgi:hypothetical protein
MGVYNAAGVRQTRAGLPVTAYTDPDPLLVVTAALIKKSAYYGAEKDTQTEGTEVQVLAYPGQIVRTSPSTPGSSRPTSPPSRRTRASRLRVARPSP